MKIKIKRYHPHFEPPSIEMEYDVPQGFTLLQSLEYIKKKLDRTLTFTSMCRSGVCGSCAVRVNDKEELACKYRPKDGDYIEPLNNSEVIRDLVVDMKKSLKNLKDAKTYPLAVEKKDITQDDIVKIERQSDCILCQSCYSSCPVYESNQAFLGPFALTRVYRYIADAREEAKKEHIDAVVQNGIWDCTLCGNCTMVCPQGIDPKGDILLLQSMATQFGYINPHMANFGSFGLEF